MELPISFFLDFALENRNRADGLWLPVFAVYIG